MKKRLFFNNPSKLLLKGLLLFALFSFNACDNSDELGLEITPPGEGFTFYSDSSSLVRLSTLAQDSITSEKRASSLLGSMIDPVFGRSGADLLTQLRLSTQDVVFGEQITVDSVQLILKYRYAYGDTTTLQSVQVYELQQDLYFDSVYYSNLSTEGFYSGSSIGSIDFYPTPSQDSLLINLEKSVAEKILTADSSHLGTNTAFLEFFKGLYIKAEPVNQGGSISYFDLAGGKSRMILYYSNAENDSLNYEVIINSNCTWLNVFSHDYGNTEIQEIINDSVMTHEYAYLQAMSGLRAGVEIQFSDSLIKRAESGIAINKAEIVFPIAKEYNHDLLIRPASLRLFAANADGTNEFIKDILVGEEYHGGSFDENTGNYRFNIALHIQNLLDPDPALRIENKGLFLSVDDPRISANRVVLKNTQGANGIRLEITYTVID